MIYIYMDESGDLGFDFSKNKITKYFAITFLITKKPHAISKIVTEIVKGFSKKEKKDFIGIIHANKESPTTCRRILRKINNQDLAIAYIYIAKNDFASSPIIDQQHLYRYYKYSFRQHHF